MTAAMCIKVVCWHGTSAAVAKIIQREGFQPDCWFSPDPRVALAMGGPVLLGVEFEVGGLPCSEGQPWQFHHPDPIPAERVVVTVALWDARIEATR